MTRSGAVLAKLIYWLAVVAISLALVVGLILFLESRDPSSLEGSSVAPPLRSA
jgi:cytochrome b subunit of formate dehydrogenase